MIPEQVQVVLIAAGWAAGVGVVGLLLSRVTAHRSFRWLVALVALVAVGGIVAGVLGTADAMFLSAHDREVVLLVCLAAGVVAIGFALAVAALMVRGSRVVRDGARVLGETGHFSAASAGPAELQELARELDLASERLRAAGDRERLLERSRRDLVAWVSHDLRSPLAGLRAMTEALEDGLADDPDRYHRQMRSEVDRMVRMVDDLFELSRIHAGVMDLSLTDVDLGDIVSEAIAGADPLARAAGIRIDGSVSPGTMVSADPNGLFRVVANLVTNAIRHTPPEGAVTITGRVVGTNVELAVLDACGGIPEEDLDRVFDVAWRGDAARTPAVTGVQGTGAGLGLAIVKGIVEAHDGAVDVANVEHGCRFRVLLPA